MIRKVGVRLAAFLAVAQSCGKLFVMYGDGSMPITKGTGWSHFLSPFCVSGEGSQPSERSLFR